MSNNGPRVSIGLPVSNGELYLRKALDSILAQTFEDFELIISDNNSVDATQEICSEYAARDRRIRSYRQEKNMGAAWNFNHLFQLSRGKYFKWAAHDDICAPTLLSRCVEVLDRDSSVALCYSKMSWLDSQGTSIGKYDVTPPTDSPKPSQRFRYLVSVNYPTFPIFGLIRSEILRKTSLFGNYMNADRALLARLALHGRFHEIPEYLFFFRMHSEQSTMLTSRPDLYYRWWDPENEGRFVFPEWRLLYEYCRCAREARVNWDERMRCYLVIGRSLPKYARGMVGDLKRCVARVLPAL